MPLGQLITVVGPTATGKSEFAVQLAQRMGGEIINADAMQLYRGMDIGTAKLGVEERHGVPHHLLDVLDITATASVAAYQRAARDIVDRLLASHQAPVLVGGSGLYLRAVFDELEFPGTDPALRAQLEKELTSLGSAVLHIRLARADPPAAQAILPTNGRRLIRALEVIELTGKPFSATLPRSCAARYNTMFIGLDRDTAELDQRVDFRVEQMFAKGLVDEVRQLEAHGLRQGVTASRALGYQHVLAAFDGVYDLATATAETARATRRLIRRQRSWFRRDDRIVWWDASRPDLVEAVLTTMIGEK